MTDWPDWPHDEPGATVEEACTVAGVGRRTLYNWMDRGLVHWRYTAGGARRIRFRSLWRAPDVDDIGHVNR